MEVELVKCDCCGLKEDCTVEYIDGVKANFDGKWLCGLCSEAVRDEINRSTVAAGKIRPENMEDAVRAHMSFCRKYKSSPASRVADGMRLMLRRRSGSGAGGHNNNSSSSSSKKYGRSSSASLVEDDSSFSR